MHVSRLDLLYLYLVFALLWQGRPVGASGEDVKWSRSPGCTKVHNKKCGVNFYICDEAHSLVSESYPCEVAIISVVHPDEQRCRVSVCLRRCLRPDGCGSSASATSCTLGVRCGMASQTA